MGRKKHEIHRLILDLSANIKSDDTAKLLVQLYEEYDIGNGAPATVIKIEASAQPNPTEIANTISKMEAHLPHIPDIPQPKNNLYRAQYRHAQNARYRVIEQQLKKRTK